MDRVGVAIQFCNESAHPFFITIVEGRRLWGFDVPARPFVPQCLSYHLGRVPDRFWRLPLLGRSCVLYLLGLLDATRAYDWMRKTAHERMCQRLRCSSFQDSTCRRKSWNFGVFCET